MTEQEIETIAARYPEEIQVPLGGGYNLRKAMREGLKAGIVPWTCSIHVEWILRKEFERFGITKVGPMPVKLQAMLDEDALKRKEKNLVWPS